VIENQRHQTREAWLNHVAQCMAPMFARLEAPLPAQLRIAIGFTSSGRRSRNIGECWDNQCSDDRHFEIFVRPDLSESRDLMPMQLAAILAHELVHAAVGVAAGHRKEFRRVARGIGLAGPMTATSAGPEFDKAMRPILEEAGPLPHGRLQPATGASSHSSRRSAARQQATATKSKTAAAPKPLNRSTLGGSNAKTAANARAASHNGLTRVEMVAAVLRRHPRRNVRELIALLDKEYHWKTTESAVTGHLYTRRDKFVHTPADRTTNRPVTWSAK
jgi:hypothetical protein